MLAYLFVILAFAVRFLPHPWQFTPVAASLLFFGAFKSRRSLWFPVALLALSDVILTKLVYSYPFTWDHLVTWAWYGAIVLLGTRLRNNSKPLWVLGAALASSVSFFLISNCAVWACFDMYPKTFGGLMTSYLMGLPFFRNDAVGDLLFTAVMFATPALLRLPDALRQRSGRPAV
jgi:Family of unknown function (DUF6580)